MSEKPNTLTTKSEFEPNKNSPRAPPITQKTNAPTKAIAAYLTNSISDCVLFFNRNIMITHRTVKTEVMTILILSTNENISTIEDSIKNNFCDYNCK